MLQHILTNSAITLIGDAAGLLPSAGAGNLYLSLHTSDPGEAGDQSTNEIAYTSYARVAVVRSGSGWTVSGAQGSNAAIVTWPASTGGSGTATHVGIGTASSGAGKLLFSGALGSSLAVTTGMAPELAIGALTVTLD